MFVVQDNSYDDDDDYDYDYDIGGSDDSGDGM